MLDHIVRLGFPESEQRSFSLSGLSILTRQRRSVDGLPATNILGCRLVAKGFFCAKHKLMVFEDFRTITC